MAWRSRAHASFLVRAAGPTLVRRAVGAFVLATLAACSTTRIAAPGPSDLGPDATPDGPTHARLVLANHRAACVSGRGAGLAFREGETTLAELAPGERRELELPLGVHTIVVDDGSAASPRTITLGPEGATLAEHCPLDRLHSLPLVPLTLVGPDAACPPDTVVTAKAGGLVIALGVGQRYTLWLPRGAHVVRLSGSPEAKVKREATVELDDRGLSLPLADCSASSGARPLQVGGP